ncbi:MAG: hypothetical protein JWR69_3218 [Pedosphaera sp.]|nr:hypothetical protein [Pedosphaera sp.]
MADVILADKEKLEEEFLSFLRETNFPDDSIFRGACFRIKEPGKWKRTLSGWFGNLMGLSAEAGELPCYADLAILDLESKEYVALVEFRMQVNEQVETEMVEFFHAVLDSMETKPPVFLVVPLLNCGFRIYQLREHDLWQELPRKNFPHYLALAAGHAAEKTVAREAKQGKALDRFTMTCHLLAGALGLLAIASIGGLTALSSGEMLLLVLVALLVIAPHTVSFRVSGTKDKPHLIRGKLLAPNTRRL